MQWTHRPRIAIYSPTGALLFSSGAFTPITFPAPAGSGIGNSGFLFGLDAAQAAQAQLAAYSGAFANNRIGLLASLSDAQGGNKTFFVGSTTTVAARRRCSFPSRPRSPCSASRSRARP